MSKVVWKKLGSPELVPSAITLRAYDGRPSSPEGLFQNVPIELGGKTILIDIEVIDAPLDYNILFGRSYMYAMKAVASSVFRTMMFPHNGKIITIDQLTHYEPNHSTNIDNILPLVRTSSDAFLSSTWVLEFSRTHPCWGHIMEHHLSYTLQHKCV
jgi:hypothetical protein